MGGNLAYCAKEAILFQVRFDVPTGGFLAGVGMRHQGGLGSEGVPFQSSVSMGVAFLSGEGAVVLIIHYQILHPQVTAACIDRGRLL